MKSFNFYSLCLVAILIFSSNNVSAEPILDKVEVAKVATGVNINIDFQTQIRYVRHTPTKEASRVQVFLEFPDYRSLGIPVPTTREFLNSPPSKLIPAFTVSFPDQKTNSIAIKFKQPVKFRITPSSNNGRRIVVFIPLPKSVLSQPDEVQSMPPLPEFVDSSAAVDIPGVPAGMNLNDYANKLVSDSRLAIAAGNFSSAIDLLNTVLNLPYNLSSQDAQELIGEARESNGELAKAKIEYELYLKLYPEGDGAKRIKKLLIAVDEKIKSSGIAAATEQSKQTDDNRETTVYGFWDQYYYDAHSHNYNPAPTKNSTTHDQSSLVSTLNITARTRKNQYDGRIVFRNRQTMDFLPGKSHSNRDRTDAAYLEFENHETDYFFRLGRQNGNTGGVLGRFDGAWFRYGFTPKFKINFVGGTLDEYRVDYRRHFYGVNFDIGPVAENWSSNIFFLEQKVKEVTDRRAIGGELRYFAPNRSGYSVVDYDTLYNRVNIAMLQGNFQTEAGTNFNFLVDYRNSPILTTTNSLTSKFFSDRLLVDPNAAIPTTLNQAIRSGLSEQFLQQLAIDNTLQTETAFFGATRQVTPRWQLGADVQVNRTSGAPGASAAAIALYKQRALENGIVLSPADILNFTNSVSSTGSIWTYHLQAVGTDVLFKGDTSVISSNYSASEISRSRSILFTNGIAPSDKWRIDSSFQFLKQDSDPRVTTTIMSPTVRASYRIKEKTSIEAEIRFDIQNTNDDTGHTRMLRDAAFIGYRIDI